MRFADLPAPPAHPLQNVGEFGQLWELVASRPHARVLEIGSLYGGTLWWWSQLPCLHTLVSIDLLPPAATDEGGSARLARLRWPDWFAHVSTFAAHTADSQDAGIFDAVADLLEGERFDFAFIDGDHSYEGVKADWHRWSPLISGLVAFHDTWPNYDRHEPGVVRWCDELRHQLPSVEFTDPDGVGICAFTMGGDR